MSRATRVENGQIPVPDASAGAQRWHQMAVLEVYTALQSTPQGLAGVEARERLAAVGPNILTEGKRRTAVRMFFEQFTDFMILVLLVAAIISGLIGEAKDTIAIAVIVILNAVIGFIQEYRAERAIAALKAMAAPTATALRDGGTVRFEPGQYRIRTTIAMSPDPLREPDREVALQLRDADYPDHAFANLKLNLLDDDQRRFEAGLLPNTVAFAVSQVSVSERDPAVQIDVLRFKPDDSVLHVPYVVRDVTATEGEDYFTPGIGTVSFEPGQRTARIFIPLVQDAAVESDEAFMLELEPGDRVEDANIFLRIAVMIRDDDS